MGRDSEEKRFVPRIGRRQPARGQKAVPGWREWVGMTLVLLGWLLAGADAGRAGDSEGIRIAKALSNAFSEIADRIRPAVVSIQVEMIVKPGGIDQKHLPPAMQEFLEKYGLPPLPEGGEPFRARDIGSGVLVDARGHIVTNDHVIAEADVIRVVRQDGSIHEATVVGRDPKTDLAVIRIDPGESPIPYAVLGDSDAMRVGNLVLAIGAPFGLEQTVTSGILSATHRTQVGGAMDAVMYKSFLQTDATINPGNSGGPLVNLDGEVIGINSAITTRSGGSDGVGFAIPSNMVKEILDELIESGMVTRGWLGVAIGDITPDIAASLQGITQGVIVYESYPGTPAHDGGIRSGDILLTYGDTSLQRTEELQQQVARTPVGTAVRIGLDRQGEALTLDVVIGKQPESLMPGRRPDSLPQPEPGKPQTAQSTILGLTVSSMDEETRKQHEGIEGVVVTHVVPESPAAMAGIGVGAVLLQINRIAVPNVADFILLAEEVKSRPSAVVLYHQDGLERFGVLPLRR